MGTNYYYIEDPCPHCNRGENKIHIGKSSVGWTFSFYGEDSTRSWKAWQKRVLSGGIIMDEYNQIIDYDDMVSLVETKENNDKNHAKIYPCGCWLDDDGHGFSGYEFS